MFRIRLTEKEIEKAIKDFTKKLTNAKASTKVFTYSQSLNIKKKEEVHIVVEKLAYKKMMGLVHNCNKEVAWHGVVTKEMHEDVPVYVIEDILVFPQEVTGSTVTSDEKEYTNWLMSIDNNTFNKLRMHGHSHVNMSTGPSGIDTTYQDNMLKNVDDFYIFMILNKRGDNWCMIYDVADNKAYEDSDIILDIPADDTDAWAKEQIAQLVKEHKPSHTVPSTYPRNVNQNRNSIPEFDEEEWWLSQYYGGYYGSK